jgi:glucan phosphoethanolaminetransferase (alkaline phosphatase superfamily)
MKETLRSIEKPSHKRTIRWLSLSLVVTIIALGIIYACFLWIIPEFTYTPQSLPEVVFKFIALSVGGLMCVVVCREYLAYYPGWFIFSGK